MTAAPTPKLGEKAKTTIMIVEPDVVIRMAIAEYLRECGYAVIEARSAEDVFTVLDSGQAVDVVFAEVNLPEMSGFELAKAIRSRDPSIGVILTSSAAAAAQKSEELCEEGPLPKPYKHAEVLRRIRLLKQSNG